MVVLKGVAGLPLAISLRELAAGHHVSLREAVVYMVRPEGLEPGRVAPDTQVVEPRCSLNWCAQSLPKCNHKMLFNIHIITVSFD